MPQLAQGVHPLPPGCTEDLSRLHPLDGEEVLNSPLRCPGSYIFPLPETRRTFPLSRLRSLDGEEVFNLVPPIAKNDEDLKLNWCL